MGKVQYSWFWCFSREIRPLAWSASERASKFRVVHGGLITKGWSGGETCSSVLVGCARVIRLRLVRWTGAGKRQLAWTREGGDPRCLSAAGRVSDPQLRRYIALYSWRGVAAAGYDVAKAARGRAGLDSNDEEAIAVGRATRGVTGRTEVI